MTEQELADLDALAAAATPGPWEQIDSRAYSSGTGLQVCLCNETDADAAFIAAARTAVPALVAEVRRLQRYEQVVQKMLYGRQREALEGA